MKAGIFILISYSVLALGVPNEFWNCESDTKRVAVADKDRCNETDKTYACADEETQTCVEKTTKQTITKVIKSFTGKCVSKVAQCRS